MTVRRAHTLVSCALLGAIAVAQPQSVAQTVPWHAGAAIQATPGTLTTPGPLASLGRSSAVAAPPAPFPPALLLNGAVDLAQGYTTNANGEQGTSSRTPDTFTRGRLDLGLHYKSLRLTADAHYSGSGYYYSRDHNLNNLVNRLNFASTSELIPDHFFFNVRAFGAPTTLSRVGRLSPNGSLNSNNDRQSYGFVATPTLRLRLGEYALSQTSVSENAVFFSQPSTSIPAPALPTTPAGNTNSISATERIVSGPRFGRLRWGLTGSYADTQQTSQSQQQSQGSIDLAYALTRVVALLATVGYGQYTSSAQLTQSVSGPTALTGVRLSTGPKFALVAEAGVRNGFATYLGSLNWNPTPTFTITGSLTDTIGMPQGNILNNLSTLAVSAEGVFSNAQSGYQQTQAQALFPQFATVSPISSLGLALDNSIYHTRSAQLAFVHQDGRNQYGLTFFGDMRDQLSIGNTAIPAASSLYGVRINASRKLRRDLTGHVGASYSLANEFGGNDRILTAEAGLNYTLSTNVNCYVTGRYLQRQSSGQTVDNVPLTDFLAIVGVRRSF